MLGWGPRRKAVDYYELRTITVLRRLCIVKRRSIDSFTEEAKMTKWVAFSCDEGERAGVASDDGVHPFLQAATLTDLLTAGPLALSDAERQAQKQRPLPFSSLRILAPVAPTSVRDTMSFHEHISNGSGGVVDPRHSFFPAFYFTNPAAIIGPDDTVPMAPKSERFDFELEIGAVVGITGRNLPPDTAESHIIGYTTFIDWSARDLQYEEMQLRLGPAKGKDTATTLGPCLTTADAFEERRSGKSFDIGMRASVNGRVITQGNWSTIDWSFADILAYVSRGTTVRAGDVIGTGTVGRGCLSEHYKTGSSLFQGWLRPGDIVEFDVDLIGSMRLTIGEADEVHPLSSGW